MVESCWAQDALIRPTAAAVVSQLAAMEHTPVADLSEDLVQHLESLMSDGVAVQTTLDILDSVRAQIKKHVDIMH
jgi:ribosomal protein S13